MSDPPQKWRMPLPSSGSHLAHDMGVGGVCVHTTRPADACSQGSALPCKCRPRAGGRHGRLWAHPERNQKQGPPDWECLEGRTRVPFTPGTGPCPRPWHGAAPGQYLLTQTECGPASPSPWTQREPGLQPRPAAALGPPSSQTSLGCHGEVDVAGPSVVGTSGQGREWTGIAPTFQVPSISLMGRIGTSEHPVSQEKWAVACANISMEENATPAKEAKPSLAVKKAWETN